MAEDKGENELSTTVHLSPCFLTGPSSVCLTLSGSLPHCTLTLGWTGGRALSWDGWVQTGSMSSFGELVQFIEGNRLFKTLGVRRGYHIGMSARHWLELVAGDASFA